MNDTPERILNYKNNVVSNLITPIAWVNTHNWLMLSSGTAVTGDPTNIIFYFQRPVLYLAKL